MPADSPPIIEVVSPQLRSDIIAGKNVNVAALLIPGYEAYDELHSHHLVLGDDVIPLKPLSDSRLSKNLTPEEFIIAFTSYIYIMCEVYPDRRDELGNYMKMIVAMANQYKGLYHKQFSVNAAQWLQKGIKIVVPYVLV